MMGDGNKPDIWQEACSRAPRQLLIDGRFVASRSGDTFDTINPATGQVLGSVAKGTPGDIDAAVAAARRALSGEWARFTPYERQTVLLRLADLVDQHFDDLARLDVLDMGVPISAINQRRTRVVSMLRFYASLAVNISGRTIGNSLPGNVSSRTVREPVGVVGAINPWNSPLGLSVWKVAPALAAGCTIILKPAEQAPLSPLRFGELCLEAGIPPGVVNIETHQPWEKFVRQIASCERVFSSSLHGLIFAESFGVPARWYQPSEGIVPRAEGHWKYLDWIGVTPRAKKWHVPASNITEIFDDDAYPPTFSLGEKRRLARRLAARFPYHLFETYDVPSPST